MSCWDERIAPLVPDSTRCSAQMVVELRVIPVGVTLVDVGDETVVLSPPPVTAATGALPAASVLRWLLLLVADQGVSRHHDGCGPVGVLGGGLGLVELVEQLPFADWRGLDRCVDAQACSRQIQKAAHYLKPRTGLERPVGDGPSVGQCHQGCKIEHRANRDNPMQPCR